MLADLIQEVTERYEALLATMPPEQRQPWIETRAANLNRDIESLACLDQRRLQQQWENEHPEQALDPTLTAAMREESMQRTYDNVLDWLWEEMEPADEYDPSSMRRWPEVTYYPNDAIDELTEHLWPQHKDNTDFMILAHTLINARMWDNATVPEEPTDALAQELEIRVLDALARREAAAAQPQS